MIILKDAYVLSLDSKREFGRYSLLIDEQRIIDITKSEYPVKSEDETKVNRWMERYTSNVQVVDCCHKIIMPPLVNSCLKSEGTFIKYLLRNRGYERSDDNLYTDFMFNYIYQELQTEEMKQDLVNIYNYSFAKNLKSGVLFLNEFSLRKDFNHINPITGAQKLTSQKINVCYPIKQDSQILQGIKYLNPSYYLTDESELTIYDISQITEQKKNSNIRLFLEVSTNKEVVEKFRHTFSKPIIMLLDEYGLIDKSTTLINPIYLSYDELKLLADRKANIIICPRDLLYFTDRYFPMDEILGHKIKYSIATGWLGNDLFKDIRIFRNKYRELNITNEMLLMSIIKSPRELYFHDGSGDDEPCCIAPNKTADLIFIDLRDIRFQLLPENFTYEKICDFIVDNISSMNISDVMINGDFKVRNNITSYFNEENINEESQKTRQKLYKVGKYKEISERASRSESSERLHLGIAREEEIRLFSDSDEPADIAARNKEIKEEFRIKGKIPIFKKKSAASQKSLFEDTEHSSIIQIPEIQETPEINLLYSEIDESKSIDDEIIYSKFADEKFLKQTSNEKKQEKSEAEKRESKIELPKNVKLKFGDE